MPTASSSVSMSRNPFAQATPEISSTVNRLTKLASRGLVPMFNSQKQVFCYALKKVDGKVVFEGNSERYTLMCLLGFDRLEKSGHASPIPIAPALESLLTNFAWIDNVGDLGLVLWTCALLAPDRLLRVASQLDLKSALTRFAYSSKNVTVHLGWFITGLSYAKLALGSSFADYDDVARDVPPPVGKSGAARHLWLSFHETRSSCRPEPRQNRLLRRSGVSDLRIVPLCASLQR